MHANQRDEIKEVRAGDIAAAVGLKDVTTGDTLCAMDHVITLERMIFPEPVIAMAVEPKTKADQEKMGIALGRLAQEDPSFRVRTDEESGPDHHRRHGRAAPGNHRRPHEARVQRVEANVGKPQVAYRETIRKAVEAGRQVRAPVGRSGQYGHVVIEMEPNEDAARASQERFVERHRRRRGPEGIHDRPCRRAFEEAMQNGVLAGFPVVDVKVTLFDGSYHDVDSNEMAFKMAGSMGFKEGFRKASPVLLEPIMKVEVVTPGRLHGRRDGRREPPSRHDLQGQDDSPSGKVINAMVPLGEMFGYATTPAFDVAGPRHVHDGIRSLRRSAEERRRIGHQEAERFTINFREDEEDKQSWQRVSSSAPSRT